MISIFVSYTGAVSPNTSWQTAKRSQVRQPSKHFADKHSTVATTRCSHCITGRHKRKHACIASRGKHPTSENKGHTKVFKQLHHNKLPQTDTWNTKKLFPSALSLLL
jgi:hypothetical protein